MNGGSQSASTSRRALLVGALGGLGAAVAGAIGRASPVRAEGQTVEVGGEYHNATSTTAIGNNSNNQAAIRGINNQAGQGVEGHSVSGHGVHGTAGSGMGVYGFSSSGPSIYGFHYANGNAIWGFTNDPDGGWASVAGSHNGGGPGVLGENTNRGHGTWGRALGSSGAGVFGESTNGRGGIFQGKKAQIRLNPSTASTHPPGGSTGDFFVDANKRLWFCKGGTNWVQLA
jgi:hypothetical protein